jgi:Trypsin
MLLSRCFAVHPHTGESAFPAGTTWRVGSTNQVFVFDPTYQENIVQQSFILHPDYEESSSPFFLKNDYAIIVLENEYTNSNVGHISPAGSGYEVTNEQEFILMGRGATMGGGQVSSIMKKAGIQDFDVEACVDVLAPIGGTVFPDINLCAVDDIEGQGACGGDSGG